MIVKVAETKENTFKDSTIDGILFNVYMLADAVNVPIVAADFLPQNVIVKCILYRNKEEITIVQNNLMILGLYSSLNYGINNWARGNVIVYPGVATASSKLISLFMDFGGPINVKEDDELYIEVTVGQTAFSSAMDLGVSFVEFNPNFAIGYEFGTPMIKSKVVQAQENSQKFSIGDNCIKLAFLNFDLDNISTQAIVTASVQSDQWQVSLNFFDLLNRHWNRLVSPTIEYRYGNTQPVTVGNQAFPYLPLYPQSVIIHVGEKENPKDIDNCLLDLSLNGEFVNASQNYVVSTVFRGTKSLVARAERRMQKHQMEKIATLPDK